MKIYKILIISMLVIQLLAPTSAYIPTETPSVNQMAYIPSVAIYNISVVTEQPEEDLPIEVIISVQNNDSVIYNDTMTLHIAMKEIVTNAHGGDEPETIIVVNQSISALPAETITNYTATFAGVYGQYTLTSYLAFNDTMIPTSIHVSIIQILGPPIGDLDTLFYAVGAIFLVPIGFMFFPAIIDVFRKKRHDKVESNGNNKIVEN